MASDLRTRKFDRFFNLLDTDGNGYIEAQDWLRAADALARSFGHAEGSSRALALHDAYGQVHQNICSAMDTDGDGRVSREEFRNGLHTHVADPSLLARTFRPAVDAEFNIADTNGDGALDSAEIQRVGEVWGLSPEDAKTAIQHMDQDGDGRVSLDEYYATWREYLTSEDPDAPAGWMLGQL